MENLFFKYGMLTIAIVVITLIITFSFNALDNTIIPPKDKGNLDGDRHRIIIDIESICSTCLKRGMDTDCSVVDISTNENITNIEGIIMKDKINSSVRTIKVYVENNDCYVKRLR